MTITVTIVAECDPPALHDERLDEDLDDLCDTAENALAGVLLNAGAGFAIDSSYRIAL